MDAIRQITKEETEQVVQKGTKLGNQITKVDQHVTEVADTLEGGLTILDKVEQRLNPVAEYVENVIFHANENNHT